MIEGVVAVVAAFEQGAELDRLVRFVVVHGPCIELHHAQRDAGRQGQRQERAEAHARHLAGVP